MKRDETISIVAALLGVIAGALLAVLVMKATAGRKLSVEGPGWSKVIAVLNTVDADYVSRASTPIPCICPPFSARPARKTSPAASKA